MKMLNTRVFSNLYRGDAPGHSRAESGSLVPRPCGGGAQTRHTGAFSLLRQVAPHSVREHIRLDVRSAHVPASDRCVMVAQQAVELGIEYVVRPAS